MGTGGFIPSNRTQLVTFYNTTGVIEKDKNIYFAPRFENEDDIVYETFIDELNAICPPPSAYEAIMLTGWSPEDRSLVVRGNIDDFRLITDTGACLNYLIVKRSITKKLPDESTVTNEYYYGFFITGVEQIGGSSVKVSVEPDDFTNVFYLHNGHSITALEAQNKSYEPFNERMKNCYVNRQHYDRVRVNSKAYILKIYFTNVSSGLDLALANSITLNFPDSDAIIGTIRGFDDSEYDILTGGDLALEIETTGKTYIDPEPSNMTTISYHSVDYTADYYSDIQWLYEPRVVTTNERVFLNQEESFRFKYQYRDQRRPFGFADVFSSGELSQIEDSNSFSSLSDNLKKKILKCCMQYLVLEMKGKEQFAYQRYIDDTDPNNYGEDRSGFANLISNIKKYASPVIFKPFFNIPDIFKKFESNIKQFVFSSKIVTPQYTPVHESSATDLTDIYYDFQQMNLHGFSDFVYSAYVVNDICVEEESLFIDLINRKIIFLSQNGYISGSNNDKGLFIVPVDFDPTSSTKNGINFHYNNTADKTFNRVNSWETFGTEVGTFLGLNDTYARDFSINVYDEKLTGWYQNSLKRNYADPVLEAEPYSFYSLSYLAYEMPFNKNRYFSDMQIKFTYFLSVNGAIKISYIPTYKIENKEYKYYNEGLIFTIPSSLPLISDSYSSYYYQNKAQMKNQYAVNDYNRGVDLAQHFFISGPNAVGMSASKRGWVGAVSETGNQFSEMANEAIDWAQSNKVIEMNQKAKLADMGAKPDAVKQTGSDVFGDLETTENRAFFNHYTIDNMSYNTIAKFLERFGYQINLFDTLHTIDRVGWNYVKLNSFDWNPQAQYDIMNEQETSIKKIFAEGVTLLHNRNYLYSGHNYEMIFEE